MTGSEQPPLTWYGDKMTFDEAWERMFGLKNLEQPKRSEYTVAYSLRQFPPQEFTARSIRLTTFPVEEPRVPILPTAPGLPSELVRYVGVEDRRERTIGERGLSSQAILSRTWSPNVPYDVGGSTYRRDFGEPAAQRMRAYRETFESPQ
jgi:hypothetical protein